jgi:Tfp pilus assembly protein PilF
MNGRLRSVRRLSNAWLTLGLALGCAGPQLHQPYAPVAGQLPPNVAASACVATADALEKAGHWREALLELDRAAQFDPKLATKHARRLATLSDRAGDPVRAQTEFARALTYDPNDAVLLSDFGYFRLRHGDFAAAEAQLRKAVALDPSNRAAWGNYAACLVKLGRFDEALTAYRKILHEAEAQHNVRVLLAEEGRADASQNNPIPEPQPLPSRQTGARASAQVSQSPSASGFQPIGSPR